MSDSAPSSGPRRRSSRLPPAQGALWTAAGGRARAAFRSSLLRWFEAHARALPWRLNHDPYRVWVAEIMLQQTRVAAVGERYEQFLRRFPGVGSLARAQLSSVLSLWSGLGYYRRARCLHAAARCIVKEHGGSFPRSAVTLAALPGIGRYTAAAVASIAFGERCAVVDGNVKRVLQRLCGAHLSSAAMWDAATQLLSRECPGDFNQAMMELGATVCLPDLPACAMCPVKRWCATRNAASGSGKSLLGAKAVRRRAQVSYAVIRRGDELLLQQRSPDARLMPDLWELPPADGIMPNRVLLRVRHAITNTDYQVTAVAAAPGSAAGQWVKRRRAANLPLTGLTRKILRRLALI